LPSHGTQCSGWGTGSGIGELVVVARDANVVVEPIEPARVLEHAAARIATAVAPTIMVPRVRTGEW
jgi:hypothetical protein